MASARVAVEAADGIVRPSAMFGSGDALFGTLAHLADIDMPASTHELIRSPDGSKVYASVYGGGIWNQVGATTLTTSTVSRNSAVEGGG